jgi:glutamate:GABA antiporter
MTEQKLQRALGLRDLILFYVVSGIGLRWIVTAAAAGQSSIIIWLVAWCGFFLPLAGCVVELSSRYPQEGGMYVWTREACGEFTGFMAGWTYWMCNLPYFPAVLYFAASSLLFAGSRGRHLESSHAYYLIFTTATLAVITVLNVASVKIGKWINNLGAIGMIVPVLTLVAIGLVSFFRFGSATRFTLHDMAPHPSVENMVFWSTIFFAFAGCELPSFMGAEIKDARRSIPRALFVAGLFITFSYVAGTAAMLVALPSASISELSGLMNAIDLLCHKVGVGILVAPLALLIAAANVGGTAAFLSSTARLPFVAGIDHYLPPIFGRVHPRWKTPYVALISYGLAGIFFGLLSQAGTSVRGAYDLLVSMSIVTNFIPYLLLFVSVLRLQSRPFPTDAFRLPGGTRVAVVLASVGILSTSATIVLSLFPAADEPHPIVAFSKIVGMTAVVLVAGAAVYKQGERSKQRALLAEKR